ncbi:MAG: hypothetical protein ACXABY_03035 [Candidatus Thorarchaeota archaeon]|jgi:hypothetical protein
MADFYDTTDQLDFFYSSGRTEPDMRQEFNNFLDGKWPEIPKAQTGLLRKMKRSSSGALVPCPCVDELTGEPDKDTFCSICHGEGWLWDEGFVDLYKILVRSDVGKSLNEELIGPGLMNIPVMIFYLRSSVDITLEDRVVEVELDSEGLPVRPYRRKRLYRIGTIVDFRSDGGRLEYWKVDCYHEKRKFLNG